MIPLRDVGEQSRAAEMMTTELLLDDDDELPGWDDWCTGLLHAPDGIRDGKSIVDGIFHYVFVYNHRIMWNSTPSIPSARAYQKHHDIHEKSAAGAPNQIFKFLPGWREMKPIRRGGIMIGACVKEVAALEFHSIGRSRQIKPGGLMGEKRRRRMEKSCSWICRLEKEKGSAYHLLFFLYISFNCSYYIV